MRERAVVLLPYCGEKHPIVVPAKLLYPQATPQPRNLQQYGSAGEDPERGRHYGSAVLVRSSHWRARVGHVVVSIAGVVKRTGRSMVW